MPNQKLSLAKTRMNLPLFEKIIKQIEKEKIITIMDGWFSIKNKDAKKNWDIDPDSVWRIDERFVEISRSLKEVPDANGIGERGCNTAACVAGHALIAARVKQMPLDPAKVARKLLGLTKDQTFTLFHLDGWPDDYQERYQKALNRGRRAEIAKVVVERIRVFIASGGRY